MGKATRSRVPASAGTARTSLKRAAQGFTLIEVMVALAITAIAITAGVQATTALTNNARRQSDVLLAHLCAENELVRLRLARQMPDVGEGERACEQAGQPFTVKLSVTPTPNPNFRRVDAQVNDGPDSQVLRLSTVIGKI